MEWYVNFMVLGYYLHGMAKNFIEPTHKKFFIDQFAGHCIINYDIANW